MIKKICVAAMALCMMLSCAQKQQQKEEAAAPATTLSGLNPADFTSEVELTENISGILGAKD